MIDDNNTYTPINVAPIASDLIYIQDPDKVTEDDIISLHLSDISTIEKVFRNPKDHTEFKDGKPRYKICCRNCNYNWILLKEETFKKYIKPFIISLN